MKISQKDADRLANEGAAVEALYNEMDAILAEAREKIEAKRDEINKARQAAYDTLDDLCRLADEFYDEKSEKWQEGDRGSAYQEWKDEMGLMRDEMGEDFEFEFPDDPDRPDWMGVLVEGIQTEPNY